MIRGEQFGAADLAAQVRGPCPRQTGSVPTHRTRPTQRRQGLPTPDRPFSAPHRQTPPTADRPRPPRPFPAPPQTDPSLPLVWATLPKAHLGFCILPLARGGGACKRFRDPFRVLVSRPCVSLCVTLSLSALALCVFPRLLLARRAQASIALQALPAEQSAAALGE